MALKSTKKKGKKIYLKIKAVEKNIYKHKKFIKNYTHIIHYPNCKQIHLKITATCHAPKRSDAIDKSDQ